MAEIRGCVPGGAAAVDPVAVSTLADDSNQSDGYSYAPTLSISAGAAGGTWSTVGVRTSDDSAVSVTGSTTTTPSATLTAADLTAGEAFRMTSTYTVGSLSDSVTSVVRVAAVGGGGAWTNVLDWSASSETFAAGVGNYTIGGLSVDYDYQGTVGPTSIDLSSGVLTIVGDSTHIAYLTIDLGENFANVPLWAVVTADAVSNVAGSSAIWWQMADDTTPANAAGHWQELIAPAGVKTDLLGRWATSPTAFANVNSRTVTDVETTPTRVSAIISGVTIRPSFDQGSASLPAAGAILGTDGPKSYGAIGGVYDTTNAKNQRYLHIRTACSATIRLAAAKGT